MTDTIASLKEELKALGPVDYSTQTRQLREMILSQIADVEWAERTPEQIAADELRSIELEERATARLLATKASETARAAQLASEPARDAERHMAKLARKGLTTCGKKSCNHGCN